MSPAGPGKYDELCTLVRAVAQAEGAILLVLDGKFGSGFSAQLPPDKVADMPDLLEEMAREIRAAWATSRAAEETH